MWWRVGKRGMNECTTDPAKGTSRVDKNRRLNRLPETHLIAEDGALLQLELTQQPLHPLPLILVQRESLRRLATAPSVSALVLCRRRHRRRLISRGGGGDGGFRAGGGSVGAEAGTRLL